MQISDRLRKQFDEFLTAQLEEEGILVNNESIEDALIDSMQSIMLQVSPCSKYGLSSNTMALIT